MNIDTLPGILKPLLDRLVYLHPEDREGRTGFAFHHPMYPMWVSWMGTRWTITLGPNRWSVRRTQPPTPEGFQHDLPLCFGPDAWCAPQLVEDGITWWLLQNGETSPWRMFTRSRKIHLHAGLDVVAPPLPDVLARLLDACQHVVLPDGPYQAHKIELRPPEQFGGTPSISHHGRMDLHWRIQDAARHLNLVDFMEDLQTSPAPVG